MFFQLVPGGFRIRTNWKISGFRNMQENLEKCFVNIIGMSSTITLIVFSTTLSPSPSVIMKIPLRLRILFTGQPQTRSLEKEQI